MIHISFIILTLLLILSSSASPNNNNSIFPGVVLSQPTSATTKRDASTYTRGVVYLDLVYTLATEEGLQRDPIHNDHLFRINIGRSGYDGEPLAVNFALPTIDLSGYRRKSSTNSSSSAHDEQLPSVPIYDNAFLMLYCDTKKYVDETGRVLDVPKELLDEANLFDLGHGKNSVFGSTLCNTVELFLKLPATGPSRTQWLFQQVPAHLPTSSDLLNFTKMNHRSQQSQGNFFSGMSMNSWEHILWGQKYCRDFYDECLFHAFSCSATYQNTKIADRSEAFPVYNLGSRFYPTTEFRNLWTAISSPKVAAVMPSDSELAESGPFGHRMSASFINLEQNAWLMTMNRLPPTRMLEVHEPFSPSDQATIIMQFEATPSRIQPEGFVFAGTVLAAAVLTGICLFLIVCKAIVPRILYLRQLESEGQEEALERIDGELIERFEKQRLAEDKRNSLIARLGRVTGAPLTPDDLEALEDWTKLPVGEMIHAAIAEERKRAMKEKLSSASDKFAAIPRVMFARALRLLDKSLFSTEVQPQQQQEQHQEQQQQVEEPAELEERTTKQQQELQNTMTNNNIPVEQSTNNNSITNNSITAPSATKPKPRFVLKSDDEIDADNIADADMFELFSDATKQTAGNVKTQINSTTTTIKNGVVFAGGLAVGVVSGAAHFVESGAQRVVQGATKVFDSMRATTKQQQGENNNNNNNNNQDPNGENNNDAHGKANIDTIKSQIPTIDVLSPEDNRTNDRRDHELQQGKNHKEKNDVVENENNENAQHHQPENAADQENDDDDGNLQDINDNNENDNNKTPSRAILPNLPRLNLEKLHQFQFQETTPQTISGLTVAAAAGASPHHENNKFFEQQVDQVNRNLATRNYAASHGANLDEQNQETNNSNHHQRSLSYGGNPSSSMPPLRPTVDGVSPQPNLQTTNNNYTTTPSAQRRAPSTANTTTVVQMTSTRRFKVAAHAARLGVGGASLPRRSTSRHHSRQPSVGVASSASAARHDQQQEDEEEITFEDVLERHLQEDPRLLDEYNDQPLPSHSFDPFSTESRPEDVPHCRRCGEVLPFVDLFAPCNCTSTATRYIHRSCLEAERRIDAFSDGGRHAEFCFRCRICRARYRVAPSSISVFGAVPMKSPLAQTLNKLLNNPVAPMLAMWVMVWMCGYLVKFVSATFTLDYLGTDWSALRVYHWVLGAFFLLSFSLCEWSLRPFFEIFSDSTRRIVIIVVACVAPLLFGYVGHFLMKLVSTIAWTWESFFGLGVVIEFLLFAWVVPQLALLVARGAGHLYDRLPLSVQRCLQKMVP